MSVPDYYERYWTGDWSPVNEVGPFVDHIVTAALAESHDCIDVGCGNGLTASRWNRPDLALTGVDVSREAVVAARARGIDAVVVSDAAVLPFKQEKFDLALCLEVFEHLVAPAEAAAEILRILRPGASLIATVPNSAYWRRRADLAVLGRWNPLGDPGSVSEPWRDPHIRFFTKASLEAMLHVVGFEHVFVGAHGGGFMRDIPVTPSLRHRGASHFYQRLERKAPALLGARLHAVAAKGGRPLAATEAAIGAVLKAQDR